MPDASQAASHSVLTKSFPVGPVSQMRKKGPRKMKWLAQDHTASWCQSWTWKWHLTPNLYSFQYVLLLPTLLPEASSAPGLTAGKWPLRIWGERKVDSDAVSRLDLVSNPDTDLFFEMPTHPCWTQLTLEYFEYSCNRCHVTNELRS